MNKEKIAEKGPEATPGTDWDNLGAESVVAESPSEKPADVLAGLDPETKAAAVEHFTEVGTPAVEAEVELVTGTDPDVIAGIGQLEAHANDPAEHAVDFSTKQDSKGRNMIYAETEDGSKKRVSADSMLIARGYDPGAYKEHKKNPNEAVEEPLSIVEGSLDDNTDEVATESGLEPPQVTDKEAISGRRVLDTAKPVADNPEDQELIDRLTTGKISKIGTKIQGARDVRAGRKEIISRQKEGLTQVVDSAKSKVWNERSRRVTTFRENNAIKRVGMRQDRRAELRKKAFEAIDAIQDPKIGNTRKRLMRAQARKNAWKEARGQVRTETTRAFAEARGAVLTAKDERDRQKARLKQVKFRPYRRRKTLGGSGSAGFKDSWRGASENLSMTDAQRKKDQADRLKKLQAKQSQKIAAAQRIRAEAAAKAAKAGE